MKPIERRPPPLRMLLQSRKSGNRHKISEHNHVYEGVYESEERRVPTGHKIRHNPNQYWKSCVMEDVIFWYQNVFLAEHENNRLEHVRKLDEEE